MKRVRIETASPYDVLIGDGALASLQTFPGRLAVVVDENVDRVHGDYVRGILANRRHELFRLSSGESQKHLGTAAHIYDWLASHRFERGEPVVAIGGGVAGDLAGFAAATWRRGVPFVQVPTTLLAQVDASVGGKVAVDHPSGKNLIGAFHQPSQVIADLRFLRTLPARELWSGLAEVVKTALLAGGPLLELVEAQLERFAAAEGDLGDVVAQCVSFKAGVVQRDPLEHADRAGLNLGHTVGHALELLGGYRTLLHGEAVAYGLRAALDLSGFAPDSREMRLVSRLQVPPLPRYDVNRVLDAMRSDKKVSAGRVKFVLLDAPGHVRWGCEVPPERVRAAVERVLSGG